VVLTLEEKGLGGTQQRRHEEAPPARQQRRRGHHLDATRPAMAKATCDGGGTVAEEGEMQSGARLKRGGELGHPIDWSTRRGYYSSGSAHGVAQIRGHRSRNSGQRVHGGLAMRYRLRWSALVTWAHGGDKGGTRGMATKRRAGSETSERRSTDRGGRAAR
jgi:hypothetical protein